MLRRSLSGFLAFWLIFSPFANALMRTAEAAPSVGAPSFSPGAVPAGVATEVIITSRISTAPGDPQLVLNGVNLLRVDANDVVLGIVGTMNDNGIGGDAVAGDGVFTLRYTVNQSTAGEIRLRVSAPFRGQAQRVLSPVSNIAIQIAQNLPPNFTSTALTAASVGTLYSYQATAQDPENGALTYQLVSGPSGLAIGQTSGLVQWTPTNAQVGPQNVQIKVSDPQNASATQSFTIQVAAPVNQPPAFTSVAPTAATVGALYSYQATALDPENGSLTFQVVSAPSSLAINPTTGLVQWNPTASQTGPQSVQLKVSDPQNASATQSFTIQVNPAPQNLPPAITSAPITSATTTLTYAYQVNAQDPEGGALTYQVASGPSGLSIGATGLVQWIPTSAQAGDQSVQLRVTDPQGASATQNFTIRVTELNLAPIITSVPATFAKTTEQYKYDLTAYDPEKKAISFSFAQMQPAGMTIDPATGAVRWNPTNAQIGTHSVSVRATDPAGAFDTQTYNIKVFNPANDLQITSPNGPQTIRIGQTLTLPLQSNYTGAVFSNSPSLTNGSITGTNFSFKPAGDQEGVQTVTFKAVYGDMQKSVVIPITVSRDNSAPAIAPLGAQTVQEGGSLSFTISATDAENDPLTYSAPTLNLANAFFNTFTRQFTFNPVVGQAGSYTVSFSVSDGRATSQLNVPITVTKNTGNQQVLNLVVDPPANPTLQTTATISGNVTGQAGVPQPKQVPPLVTALVPSQAKQGQTLTVQITGLNTAFGQTTSRADFGDGIVVNSLTVASPTSAQANITIDKLARTGTRTVRMLTAGGEAPAVIAFNVDKGVASIAGTVIDPFTNQPLVNARVSINGTTISTLTDSQGRFVLNNVPNGTVPLIITLPNYDVQRVTVAVGANETVNLEAPIKVNALARPPTFVGSLPRAATVASVLDRGVTAKGGGLTLDQAKAVIQDTMIAVGGIEAGVFDSAGNQLNPQITGAGEFSLSQEAVDAQARALLRGDVITLRDFLAALSGAFSFPGGLSVSLVVEQLQQVVDAAWANPADPQSAMAITLFNQGTALSPRPPRITRDTSFNSFQILLLTSSFLVFNRPFLESSIDAILKAKNINGNALVPPPRFSQRALPGASTFAWSNPVTTALKEAKEWLLPSAYAAEPIVDNCGNVTPCRVYDLTFRRTYTKVWSAMKSNLFAEAAQGALTSAALAAVQLVAVEAILGFLLVGGITGGVALGPLLGTIALSLIQGAAMVVMFKLVVGWGVALTAASLEPTPPSGDGSAEVGNNFVIKFRLSPEHLIPPSQPQAKIKKRFTYHLFRVPDCIVPIDEATTEYIPVQATPDFTDPVNKNNAAAVGPNSKPFLGRHQFIVPPALLKDGQNCFRIRAFQYLYNADKDFVEGLPVYDTNHDGVLDLDELRNGGFGDVATMTQYDLNKDGKLDAGEYNKLQDDKKPANDFQVLPGVPNSSTVRQLLGRYEVNPNTYANQIQTRTLDLKNQISLQLNNVGSEVYRARNTILALEHNASSGLGSAFPELKNAVPQLETFVNNANAFRHADQIVSTIDLNLPVSTTPQDDGVFAGQLAESAAQQHLKRSATQTEVAAVQEMVAAKRTQAQFNAQSKFANEQFNFIEANGKAIINAINAGKSGPFTYSQLLPGYSPRFQGGSGVANFVETTINIDATNAQAVIDHLGSQRENWRSVSIVSAQDGEFVKRGLFEPQVEVVLKSGLRTTSGLDSQQVESLYRGFTADKGRSALSALPDTRIAAENEEGVRQLVGEMKRRQAGVNRTPIDPQVSRSYKAVGSTLTNTAAVSMGVSSGLMTFLQSVQVLSSDFSPDCFTTLGSGRPSQANFPPAFEPYPGTDEPSAIIRGSIDPNNPKTGFLTREYPGDDPSVSSVEAGFPPGFISVDSQQRIYAVNLNSIDRFGGRIFRYRLDSVPASDGGHRTLALAQREFVGAINYYSLDLLTAHPASPAAMTVGPTYDARAEDGSTVKTQDLYLADIDFVSNQKRILQVPTSLIDTARSSFFDANGNEKLRYRIVGQAIVASDEFRFSGPSDMEVGPDLSLPKPMTTANSVIMMSDEDIIWAIGRDSQGAVFARKVIQIPGRRWSGLAFDNDGKFYFADYASKDIFVMGFANFSQAVRNSIQLSAPFIPSETALRDLAFRITTLDLAPGDIELEYLSSHPGGVLHISTDKGIVPINFPILGQVGSDVREIKIRRFSREEHVAIAAETIAGASTRVFRAFPSHEDLNAGQATLSVKRVDETGREYWQDEIIFLGSHGVSLREGSL